MCRSTSVRVKGRGWNCIEQFVAQLHDTIEEFSLDLHYSRLDQAYFRSNADPFTDLCKKLHRLRSVKFSMLLRVHGEASLPDMLDEFTRSFRTPYWLDGPLGRVNVAVDTHRFDNLVQITSLPYAFPWTVLLRTVDFVNVQFNTQEEQTSSRDPPTMLESSWVPFRCVAIRLDVKELVPLAFLRALQSAHAKSKFRHVRTTFQTLALDTNRGILPENACNHIQLTRFDRLELRGRMQANRLYTSQGTRSLVLIPLLSYMQ